MPKIYIQSKRILSQLFSLITKSPNVSITILMTLKYFNIYTVICNHKTITYHGRNNFNEAA